MNYLEAENSAEPVSTLQQRLLSISLFNFFLLSVVGLYLRAYSVLPVGYFDYKNLLHAHSHFAFGGWIIPMLVLVVMKCFPELSSKVAYVLWRNIVLLFLISAYGMLFTFPFQGYGPYSITFSTISLATSFYFGIVVMNAMKKGEAPISWSFLRAGFMYAFLSAIGPFATAPIMSMGNGGTPLYYDAIYFYLHFQYNGFFVFLILAAVYRFIEQRRPTHNGKISFLLFNLSCVPAYCLSILWSDPGWIFNLVGGMAALLQIVATYFLLKDVWGIKIKNDLQKIFIRIAFVAFVIKNILQLLSAVPFIAQLAYQTRNFIIAYLHLVLLGSISIFLLIIISNLYQFYQSRNFKIGLWLFLFAFITTESVLLLNGIGLIRGSSYPVLMFFLSIFFPTALALIWLSSTSKKVMELNPAL
jgi:hypothetical protein